jgi:chromosome segregation ATPase
LTPSRSVLSTPPKHESPLRVSSKKRRQGPPDAGFNIYHDVKLDSTTKRVEFANCCGATILSPKAVKELTKSVVDEKTYERVRVDDVLLTISNSESSESMPRRTRRNRSMMPNIPPEVMRVLGHVGGAIGAGLLEVGKDVGVGATNAVISLGSAVGDHAEKLVDKASLAIPRYSQVEVRSMMEKKNSLLNELAQASLQLGIYQDKQHNFEIESVKLRNHEEHLAEKLVQQENTIQSLKQELSSARHDTVVCKNLYDACIRDTQDEIQEWKRLCNEHKDRCCRLLAQLNSSEQTILSAREELSREREIFAKAQECWDLQTQRISTDQSSFRSEMDTMVNNMSFRLKNSELAREEAESRVRHVQELMILEQQKGASDAIKYNANTVSQQEWFSQQLSEKEKELNEMNRQLTDANARLSRQESLIIGRNQTVIELTTSLEHANTEIESLRSLNNSDRARIAEFDDMVNFYRSQLMSHEDRAKTLVLAEQKLAAEIGLLKQQAAADQRDWQLTAAESNNCLQEALRRGSSLSTELIQLRLFYEEKVKVGEDAVSALQAANTSISVQVGDMKTRFLVLSAEMESITIESDVLQAKNVSLASQIITLNDEIHCLLSKLESSENHAARLQQEVIGMEDALSKMEERCRSELREHQTVADATAVSLSAELQNKSLVIAALTLRLNDAVRAVETAEAERLALSATLTAAEEESVVSPLQLGANTRLELYVCRRN